MVSFVFGYTTTESIGFAFVFFFFILGVGYITVGEGVEKKSDPQIKGYWFWDFFFNWISQCNMKTASTFCIGHTINFKLTKLLKELSKTLDDI